MKKIIIILTLLTVAVFLSGCTKETEKAQIANPASEFCINHGGKLNIVTANDGSQSGLCTLNDGKVCEEWAYFRGECNENEEVKACTLEYAPLCGEDGITYGNKCMADNKPIRYTGECKDAAALNKPCTREYVPVCGVNQVTYSNKCEAGDVKVDYSGECN